MPLKTIRKGTLGELIGECLEFRDLSRVFYIRRLAYAEGMYPCGLMTETPQGNVKSFCTVYTLTLDQPELSPSGPVCVIHLGEGCLH